MGVFATLGTSPAEYRVEDERTVEIAGADVLRFRVLLSEEAWSEGVASLWARATGNVEGFHHLAIVPDDEALDILDLLEPESAAGSIPLLAGEICEEGRACELAFTLDAEGDGRADIELRASATKMEEDFSEGANAEILLDD